MMRQTSSGKGRADRQGSEALEGERFGGTFGSQNEMKLAQAEKTCERGVALHKVYRCEGRLRTPFTVAPASKEIRSQPDPLLRAAHLEQRHSERSRDAQSMTTPIPEPPSLASTPPAMGFVA